MLDSGRQWQSVETIKKYIDMASMLKLNRFHWHLTEGLGCRPEIKAYPNLTEIGANVGHAPVRKAVIRGNRWLKLSNMRRKELYR